MLLTTGNMASLVQWFDTNRRFKFLCLLVGGHQNDVSFFAKIYNNQQVLDTISGENIAVFLFAHTDRHPSENLISINKGEGEYEVLPGQILLSNKSSDLRGISYWRINDL
jgi:hypothetical protein